MAGYGLSIRLTSVLHSYLGLRKSQFVYLRNVTSSKLSNAKSTHQCVGAIYVRCPDHPSPLLTFNCLITEQYSGSRASCSISAYCCRYVDNCSTYEAPSLASFPPHTDVLEGLPGAMPVHTSPACGSVPAPAPTPAPATTSAPTFISVSALALPRGTLPYGRRQPVPGPSYCDVTPPQPAPRLPIKRRLNLDSPTTPPSPIPVCPPLCRRPALRAREPVASIGRALPTKPTKCCAMHLVPQATFRSSVNGRCPALIPDQLLITSGSGTVVQGTLSRLAVRSISSFVSQQTGFSTGFSAPLLPVASRDGFSGDSNGGPRAPGPVTVAVKERKREVPDSSTTTPPKAAALLTECTPKPCDRTSTRPVRRIVISPIEAGPQCPLPVAPSFSPPRSPISPFECGVRALPAHAEYPAGSGGHLSPADVVYDTAVVRRYPDSLTSGDSALCCEERPMSPMPQPAPLAPPPFPVPSAFRQVPCSTPGATALLYRPFMTEIMPALLPSPVMDFQSFLDISGVCPLGNTSDHGDEDLSYDLLSSLMSPDPPPPLSGFDS